MSKDLYENNTSNSSTSLFSLCDEPINTSSPRCLQLSNNITVLLVCLYLSAILIVIILSFMQRRVKLCQHCLWGRPGLVVPVNLVHDTKHRLIYMLIFGTMSSAFFAAIIGQISPTSISIEDPYLKSVISIVVTIIYGLSLCIIYYPVFACVDPPIPLIGHIIGALYTALLIASTAVRQYTNYIGCTTGCQTEGPLFAIQVLGSGPVLLIELFLFFWFIGKGLFDVFLLLTQPGSNHSHYDIANHCQRVRHLFKRQHTEPSRSKMMFLTCLLKIYPFDPGFKFPLRFLAAMIISIVILYKLTLTGLYFTISVAVAFGNLRLVIIGVGDLIISSNVSFGISDSLIQDITQGVGGTIVGIGVLLPVGVFMSSMFCSIQLFLIFRNVSNHLHRSARGDLSFLPENLPDLKACMLSSLRYPGYQVAYLVWGWFVYGALSFILLLVLGICIAGLIFLRSFLIPKISTLIIGLAWAQILYWSQFFFTKYFFLEKAYPDSNHRVIQNRRLFHWFAYVFLFQNAFVGIFSTFLRLLTSLPLGLILFLRLDKVLLMRGFEVFDLAHKTYIGFLYLDYTQNNSVLNVFCHLLLRANARKRLEESDHEVEMTETNTFLSSFNNSKTFRKYVRISDDKFFNDDSNRPLVSQRAYNRWKVAYTLIRNEQLLEHTAVNLQKNRGLTLSQKLERRAGFLEDSDPPAEL